MDYDDSSGKDHGDHVHGPEPAAADDHGHEHELAATGDHDHDDEGAEHSHGSGPLAFLGEIFHVHQHDVRYDEQLEGSAEGIRTLRLSLAVLGVTAVIQLIVALQSGSVGLLADTIHNFSDALTAIPLWLAFLVARRPANRRYTYGYGRAEDLAGVAIVLIILASAVLAFWESYRKLIEPTPLPYVGWVMIAAVIGFLGNEAVAILRIRTGRRIGSAALEADGRHAQIDGITSLGVLVGAVAVWLGYPIADPIVGMLISVIIVFVSRDAARTMWRRLMDAIEPGVLAGVERVARDTPGVEGVENLRVRWLGHRLWAELNLLVDENVSLRDSHTIAEEVRHRLFHAEPRLAQVSVHVDPSGSSGLDHHAQTSHHE